MNNLFDIAPEQARAEMLALIREVAYAEGDFTLASGKKSKYYIDGRRVTIHPRGAVLAGVLFADAIRDLLEAGGEPILLARGKRIVAALISLKDFEERFVARAASEARLKILEEMDEMARPSSVAVDSARLLRELRDHG